MYILSGKELAQNGILTHRHGKYIISNKSSNKAIPLLHQQRFLALSLAFSIAPSHRNAAIKKQ